MKHLLDHSTNEIADIEITGSHHTIACYSLYCRPLQTSLWEFIPPLLVRPDFNKRHSILCLDANAHSPLLNGNYTDTRGRELEEACMNFSLNVCNVPKNNLDYVPSNTTLVDVTVAGDVANDKLEEVLERSLALRPK